MVGYSQGGLIGLHAIKYLQAHLMVRRMVTLGSPVDGTWLGMAGIAALGAISPAVWQLLPGSKFIEELNAAPLPPTVRMRQIHAAADALVPTTAPMIGVEPEDYIVLPGGHSSLVVAPHFYEAIREFLDAPETSPSRRLRLLHGGRGEAGDALLDPTKPDAPAADG